MIQYPQTYGGLIGGKRQLRECVKGVNTLGVGVGKATSKLSQPGALTTSSASVEVCPVPKTSPALQPRAANGNHSQEPSHAHPVTAQPPASLFALSPWPGSEVRTRWAAALETAGRLICLVDPKRASAPAKMTWRHVLLLSCLSAMVLLSSEYGESRVELVSCTVKTYFTQVSLLK